MLLVSQVVCKFGNPSVNNKREIEVHDVELSLFCTQ